MDNGPPMWMGCSRGVLDCGEDEIHVEGMATRGVEVETGAVVARMASWKQLLDADGQALSSWGMRVVTRFRSLLALDTAPTGTTEPLARRP